MQYEIRETQQYRKWFKKIDNSIRIKILARITSVENGNLGDTKSINKDISELRFRSGSGTRIYYTKRGDTIILLLIGGNKSSQVKDIKQAKKILEKL